MSPNMVFRKNFCFVSLTLVLLTLPPARAQRTQLKPGWNLFSPEQDVEIGRQVSTEAEKQMEVLHEARVEAYLNRMAQTLAAKAPGASYSYQVKAVNDMIINAFALPGGFLYFNRGVIEAARNEAQLAGVIGHEIGHVALRHGTNQASKAALTQGIAQSGLAILGGVIGRDSLGGVIANLATSFGANSILLKYSRDAERQADLAGTHMLYDNNFDPRAMIQFFEILEQKSGGRSRMLQWLSTHPNPGDRMQLISVEIDQMGGLSQNFRADSSEFRNIQRLIKTLPPPKEKPKTQPGQPDSKPGESAGGASRPDPPSSRLLRYENAQVRLRYPQNWKISEENGSATLAPENGTVADAQGNSALAYGMMVAFSPAKTPIQSPADLEQATSQLVRGLQQSNPKMRLTKAGEPIRAGRERALATTLVNESPLGGSETVWLVTVAHPQGLLQLVCVAPEKDFTLYSPAFRNVVDSLVLR